MQQFKITPEGLNEIKKQSFRKTLPVMIIAVIAGLIITFFNAGNEETDYSSLFISIPLITIALVIGFYRGAQKQKILFQSFTISITDNLITREQLNTPTVSIYFNDITEIVKNKNETILIRGKYARDIIYIPKQIDHYDELEEILHKIIPVATKNPEPFLQKYRTLVSLLTIGLMLCVFIVNNKIIVGISGIAFIGLCCWSFLDVRRNKNIDEKTKRSMWWILIVVSSVVYVMVLKLGYAFSF